MTQEIGPDADWEQAYRKLRWIKQSVAGPSRALDVILGGTESRMHAAIQYFEGSRNVLDMALAVRPFVRAALAESRNFVNVYHCAVFLECNGAFGADDKARTRLYRGERCFEWSTSARLYRTHKDGTQRTQESVARGLDRLEALVDALTVEYPWLSEQQAIAIAQHYGGEVDSSSGCAVDVDTWLVDVTWDPWVALFFASLRGENGQVGIVKQISIPEMQELLGDRLAGMRIVRAPRIRRIRNQKGLFLDMPYPELLDEYSPVPLCFSQRQGMVFTDEALGVTHESMFPIEDEIRDSVLGWAREYDPRDSRGVWPMETRAPHDRPILAGTGVYEELVLRSLRIKNDEVPDRLRLPFLALVTFHVLVIRRLGNKSVNLRALIGEVAKGLHGDRGFETMLDALLDAYHVPSNAGGPRGQLVQIAERVKAAYAKGFETLVLLAS